jgi:Transglycosylase SLT domain
MKNKWKFWCVLSLLITVLMVTPTVANMPSKEDMIRNNYIDWMYKNMDSTTKQKLGSHAQKELNYIYTRVNQERYPDVKLTIIRLESRFNQKARGTHGERCLMQISPSWTNKLKAQGIIQKPEDLTNSIDACIAAGSYIFNLNYSQYKDVVKTVRAYNGGGDPHYVENFIHAKADISIARDNAEEQYREINQ